MSLLTHDTGISHLASCRSLTLCHIGYASRHAGLRNFASNESIALSQDLRGSRKLSHKQQTRHCSDLQVSS